MTATYPSLKKRTVLITGGATGIGADITRAFHAQGAHVAFLDIQEDAGRQLTDDLPGCTFIRGDVTDIPDLQTKIQSLEDKTGPIQILINNAANDKREALVDITPNDWDLSQNVNLRPHFFAAQTVAPGMKAAGGGAIINLSSVAWRLGHGDMAPYVTAKSAIIGLTNALADALGPDLIRVNAIEPGAVLTDRQRAMWFQTQDAVDAILARQTIPVEITGHDIAAMALFLASDQARAITKQSFIVDAGLA